MVASADRSNQPIFPMWDTPYNWPWPITILVSEARRIISYFEIPEKMRPPKSIWHSPDKCHKWIEDQYDPDKKGKSGELTFDDYERQ